ncbi:MAG: hypothetical protein IJX00_02870 [Clostridia bacterium]|nr:hypothetical protein [Clostridia bacterium]
MKYNYNDMSKTYSIRELSRGKTSEAVTSSSNQPVLIIKNSKPVSIVIDYNEYLKIKKILENKVKI